MERETPLAIINEYRYLNFSVFIDIIQYMSKLDPTSISAVNP